LREVAGGYNRWARGAVRERATRAAGSRAQSDAGGWVRRFGRATRGRGLLRDGPVLVCEQAECGEVGRREGRRWAAVSRGLGWGKERLGWFGLD